MLVGDERTELLSSYASYFDECGGDYVWDLAYGNMLSRLETFADRVCDAYENGGDVDSICRDYASYIDGLAGDYSDACAYPNVYSQFCTIAENVLEY